MIPSIKTKDRSHISTSTRLSLGSKKSSSFGSTYPIQSEYSGKQQYLRTWEEPTFESILYSSSPSALPTFFSPNIYIKSAPIPKQTLAFAEPFSHHTRRFLIVFFCSLRFFHVPCYPPFRFTNNRLSTLAFQTLFYPWQTSTNSLFSLLFSHHFPRFLHPSFVSNKHTHIAYPL